MANITKRKGINSWNSTTSKGEKLPMQYPSVVIFLSSQAMAIEQKNTTANTDEKLDFYLKIVPAKTAVYVGSDFCIQHIVICLQRSLP